MSTLEINIDNYITEEEKKQIAKETFQQACFMHFKDEDSVKRIISNSAYDIVYKMVDEHFNLDLELFFEDKIVEIINKMDWFHLFKKPDSWSCESNSAYQILEKTLLDNKDIIERNVKKHLPEATMQAIKADLKEYIQGAVNRHYDELEA